MIKMKFLQWKHGPKTSFGSVAAFKGEAAPPDMDRVFVHEDALCPHMGTRVFRGDEKFGPHYRREHDEYRRDVSVGSVGYLIGETLGAKGYVADLLVCEDCKIHHEAKLLVRLGEKRVQEMFQEGVKFDAGGPFPFYFETRSGKQPDNPVVLKFQEVLIVEIGMGTEREKAIGFATARAREKYEDVYGSKTKMRNFGSDGRR